MSIPLNCCEGEVERGVFFEGRYNAVRMDAIAEIKQIYYAATKATIENDIDRAIDLLKTLPTDDDREKVAVYMDGLAQMRTEWKQAVRGGVGATAGPRPPSGARKHGGPPERSGRSTASSRRNR